MNLEVRIGRISEAELVLGGRYNSEVGIKISISADVHRGQHNSAWEETFITSVPFSEGMEVNALSAMLVTYLGQLLTLAGVEDMQSLIGKPAACEFRDGVCTSWTLAPTVP